MSEQTTLSIGMVTRLYGISHDTLRLYDRKGLLKPLVDPQTNYRRYTLDHLAILDILMTGKAAGTSLASLKAALDEASLEGFEKLYQQQLELIEKKKRQLDHAQTDSQYLLELVKRAAQLEKSGFRISKNPHSFDLAGLLVKEVLALSCTDAPSVWSAEFISYVRQSDGVKEDEEVVWLLRDEVPVALEDRVIASAHVASEKRMIEGWGTRAQIEELIEQFFDQGEQVFARFDYLVPRDDDRTEYLFTLYEGSKTHSFNDR